MRPDGAAGGSAALSGVYLGRHHWVAFAVKQGGERRFGRGRADPQRARRATGQAAGRRAGGFRGAREEKLRIYRSIEKEHFSEAPLEAIPPVHRLVYMTLRRGILGEEAWLEWADELQAVLESLR